MSREEHIGEVELVDEYCSLLEVRNLDVGVKEHVGI